MSRFMARRSWFEREQGSRPEDDAPTSPFSGSIERLESWQRAIEDGIIEPHEVAEQKDRLVALLRELEPMLDDAQHEKVTRVLEEWAVLQAMHGTLLVEEFSNGGPARPQPEDEGPAR
ncbi:MAG: hypothetical protein K0S65_2179 [Labilithrix sp.]|nr:hypothetical protein [Labilithrix sp.]